MNNAGIRVELLIRTILTGRWDDDAWPLLRQESGRSS